MTCSDLEPPGGLKFYQLGIAGNESHLETYFEKTGINIYVVDADTECRVLQVCNKMEASLSPGDKAPLLFHIVTTGADQFENLKMILGLGVSPQSSNHSNVTAVISAIGMCNSVCASALIDCRPWDAHDDVEVVQWRDRAKFMLQVHTVVKDTKTMQFLKSVKPLVYLFQLGHSCQSLVDQLVRTALVT